MLSVTICSGDAHRSWELFVTFGQNTKRHRLLAHLDDLLNHKSAPPSNEPTVDTLPEDSIVDMEVAVGTDTEETAGGSRSSQPWFILTWSTFLRHSESHLPSKFLHFPPARKIARRNSPTLPAYTLTHLYLLPSGVANVSPFHSYSSATACSRQHHRNLAWPSSSSS